MKKQYQKRLAKAKAEYCRVDAFFVKELALVWEEIEKLKRRKYAKQSFFRRAITNLMSFAQSSAAKWRNKMCCKKV